MFKKMILISILALSTQAFALDDHEIVKVVLTANEGQKEMAEVAVKKAQSQPVKEFANMMIQDHKGNTTETKALAKQEKIDPKKSDLSKNLEKDGDTWLKDIKKADKGSFDKTYMGAEVTSHEKVLATLDDTLIPQANNAALKAKLQKTREAVAAHLTQAKDIQSKLH